LNTGHCKGLLKDILHQNEDWEIFDIIDFNDIQNEIDEYLDVYGRNKYTPYVFYDEETDMFVLEKEGIRDVVNYLGIKSGTVEYKNKCIQISNLYMYGNADGIDDAAELVVKVKEIVNLRIFPFVKDSDVAGWYHEYQMVREALEEEEQIRLEEERQKKCVTLPMIRDYVNEKPAEETMAISLDLYLDSKSKFMYDSTHILFEGQVIEIQQLQTFAYSINLLFEVILPYISYNIKMRLINKRAYMYIRCRRRLNYYKLIPNILCSNDNSDIVMYERQELFPTISKELSINKRNHEFKNYSIRDIVKEDIQVILNVGHKHFQRYIDDFFSSLPENITQISEMCKNQDDYDDTRIGLMIKFFLKYRCMTEELEDWDYVLQIMCDYRNYARFSKLSTGFYLIRKFALAYFAVKRMKGMALFIDKVDVVRRHYDLEDLFKNKKKLSLKQDLMTKLLNREEIKKETSRMITQMQIKILNTINFRNSGRTLYYQYQMKKFKRKKIKRSREDDNEERMKRECF
jgi:hypothetical protein